MTTPDRDFAARLIDWHRLHGRHDLPWQRAADPYRIWLSEIMLQQTQVETVIPYYDRFIARFPDIATLAAADVDAVMALWSGLGYYARARNLHACARQVVHDHEGEFPSTAAQIATLPGIGRSTAAAIAVFAFGERAAILDGNVKRVLCRVFGIEGFPGATAVERALWDRAQSLLPAENVAIYTQAQMDLGATVCTRGTPQCSRCPLAADCIAWRDNRCRELPTPRPRKVQPVRSCQLAVMLHNDSVLLVKRPPRGIWGGLLSLPEIDGDTLDSLPPGIAANAESGMSLPTLRHTFTHFILDIHALLWRVDTRGSSLPANHDWYALETLDTLGLPAPIRRILVALQNLRGSNPEGSKAGRSNNPR